MGNTSSQPRVTIRAKGRGPIPPAILNLQNGLDSYAVPTGTYTGTVMTGPIVPSYPVVAPPAMAPPVVAAPIMATTTTTDTVLSGPMLPPRLPPVPVIDHPIQPGIYGATQVGPSTVETYTFTQPPFLATPQLIEETTVIHATAPPQPSPLYLNDNTMVSVSPQPSPPVTYQQQQMILQQQHPQLQQIQMQQLQQIPPLPAGYADQTEFYQGNAAYASDTDDDDSGSYTSIEEEMYVAPPPQRRSLGAPSAYAPRRASPNYAGPTFLRESPPPAYLRESPPPAYLRESPPPAYLRESPYVRESTLPTYLRDSPPPSSLSSSPVPLSARSRRSAYTVADTPLEPYERYGRSLAYERYQQRVNSRMSSYDQTPDRYGFYPNAYRI